MRYRFLPTIHADTILTITRYKKEGSADGSVTGKSFFHICCMEEPN